ncbi:MAG TPA: CdaR family protein [Pyrinomonadaceae bacterium]|nr:CdaR family protein [Pyrinomonadaceae bacterium]
MAFRDGEGRLRGAAAEAPGVAQRWLREALLEDWWLKLLALAIALAIWFGVTSQRAPATLPLRDVPLSFLLPEDVEVSNDPVDKLRLVTLQGRRDELDRLDRHDLDAAVDVKDLRLGERVVRLAPENVTMNLPAGVRVVKVEPESVALRLERRIEREVEVVPRLEGGPPEGYEARGWQVAPARVRVRGPQSRVAALENVPTETISLEGQTQPLELKQTNVDIADPKVVALDPVVSVRVDIGAERVERTVYGVAVRAPAGDASAAQLPERTNVTVRVERSALDALRPESLEVFVERAPDGSLRTRLQLPPELRGRAELGNAGLP